jgi:Cu(I)/Ag(I) efflux system membrane fusion protein
MLFSIKKLLLIMTKKLLYFTIPALLGGFLIGWMVFKNASQNENHTEHIIDQGNKIWTCSMHPQIKQKEPGKCPLCGMELVELNTDMTEGNPLEIKMSANAIKLANIQTIMVHRSKAEKVISLNGKTKANEKNIYSQSSHIPGRIENLKINFTGEFVTKGQIIAEIYSPELVTSQEELFEAYKIRSSQPALFEAAKKKLKNWKLTDDQISDLIKSEKSIERFPILADVSGVILKKHVNLGDYIKKGQAIYEIANLSSIWVNFDIYESDLSQVKIGSPVTYSVKSYPGEEFSGTISFIDPIIDSKKRVATARVEAQNPGLKFKPDMFVEGTMKSQISTKKEALIIPKSAIMWTGKRSVVYVKTGGEENLRFVMREVVLGAAAGDGFIIDEGLQEGEEIASNGTFSIDAAAQLSGKPSMMNHDHDSKKSSFKVYGNCEMCKNTIENSLKGVDGVISANWNRDTKIILVNHNQEIIKLNDIKNKINSVGYDTEDMKASDHVYKTLPACCQYERETK